MTNEIRNSNGDAVFRHFEGRHSFVIGCSPLVIAILLALAQSIRSQPLTFNTLAGNPPQGSADGTGSSARFNNPWGVAADSSGNIYAADTDNHTIRKITSAGV